MKKKMGLALLLAGVMALTGCRSLTSSYRNTPSSLPEEEIVKGNQELGISCHDPQIIYADGNYYMTGSHMVLAKSEDLMSWDYISNGSAKNYIENLYSGNMDAFSYVGKNEEGGYSVWAGNIFYNETMGKYCLYFCTSSTYIKSTLALAVSDTPEGPYTYTDTLLYSGFSKKEADQTNLFDVVGEEDTARYFKLGGYNNMEWPNCIDPAIYTDADGKLWMVYGSWSGGIFELEIDPATGLPIHPEAGEGVDPYFGYHLIGGGHHAVEGPYITYNADNGYYYLFASYGNLQREGGYQMRQFRSQNPTGPYVDAAGRTLEDEDDYFSFGVKMAGNYTLPSLKTAYMAPGGQSVFTGEDGATYITYHQRFDSGTEYHEPRVHRLYLTEDDWYVMTPFAYMGDADDTNVSADEFNGIFYVVNHETDVSNVIHRWNEREFHGDGTVTCDQGEGTYEVVNQDGVSYLRWNCNGNDYEGPILRTRDEAGNSVICFMVTGETNETLWGVRYLKD